MKLFGERNGMSKLTQAEVVTIRERHAAGETRKALALEYGLAVSTIGRIVTGQKWPHAPGPIVAKGTRGRLSQADVAEIRRLYREEKLAQRKIAERFGTTQGNVSSIVLGKTYKMAQ
jgi:transcriptional regulator with XRE-family HTH domain